MTHPISTLIDQKEVETALASLLPTNVTHTLYCHNTGVPIAAFSLVMQAGKLPYISLWKDSLAVHPLFSLPQRQLLMWTRKNWNILFRNNATDAATFTQRQQFQIAFVAILHSFGSIKIETPCLPSFDTVNANMQRLFELAYWHNYLDSKRFKFPTYRITKTNNNTTLNDVAAYLGVCESVKEDWESSKDALLEEEKVEAARRAEKSVRSSHVRAVSKKALWNWFLSCLSSTNAKKYTLPEWIEWKDDSSKIWFASENGQLQYAIDDIDAIEEVFLSECPIGNILSHAFLAEVNKIRTNIRNHVEIFSIDWETTMRPAAQRTDKDGNVIAGSSGDIANNPPETPGPAPQPYQFSSRVEFIRAEAKWKIHTMQWKAWHEKYGREAHDKQGKDDNDTTKDIV